MADNLEDNHSNDDIDLSQVIADTISSLAPHKNDESQQSNENTRESSDLQPNEYADNEQPEHEPNDSGGLELDLESAIGNVFSQFDFTKTHQDEGQQQQEPESHHQEGELTQGEEQIRSQQSENHDQNYPQQDDDRKQQDATHATETHQDAQTNVSEDTNTSHDNIPNIPGSSTTKSEQKEKEFSSGNSIANAIDDDSNEAAGERTSFEPSANHEEGIDDAIGNAFSNAMKEHFGEQIESATDERTKSNVDNGTNGQVAHNEKQDYQDEDKNEDLEQAIGNAFSNFISEESQKSPESAQVSEANRQNNSKDSAERAGNNDDDDQGLQDAIGNAFSEIFKSNDQGIEASNDETAKNSDPNIDPKDQESSLNDSIEDVFKDIMHQSGGSHKEPESTTQSNEIDNNDKSRDMDDLDLNAAIGDAFKIIMPEQKEQSNQTEQSEHTSQGNEHDDGQDGQRKDDKEYEDNDMDLENAIGEAFKSITGDSSSKTPEVSSTNSSAQQANITDHDDSVKEDEGNDDLAALISASFKKVMDSTHHDKKPAENLQVSENDTNINQEDDKNMENAITEAFMSAMNTEQLSVEGPSSTDSTHVASDRRKSDTQPVDLSKIVQSLVDQMATSKEDKQDKHPISQDVLKGLALEITSQVQDHLAEDESTKKQNTVMNLPQIEENVLAHFQKEAEKDLQSQESIPKSKMDSIVQVVRNAIKTNDIERAQHPVNSSDTVGNSTDLENLQMNDILQNAFMMAMENPQDLLQDLEMDEVLGSTSGSKFGQFAQHDRHIPGTDPNIYPGKTGNFTRTQGAVGALEDFNRNQRTETGHIRSEYRSTDQSSLGGYAITPGAEGGSSGENDDKAQKGKTLSIAETLALHRSSMMNGPRRDYSTIESLEEALNSDKSSTGTNVTPIRSQISNVINSITSRMNNNAVKSSSDTHLLGAIQKMTKMLSSGGSINNTSLLSILRETPSVTEIISTYKEIEEKETMINSLILAKNFLDKSSSPVAQNAKAASLIETVIKQFRSDTDSDSNASSTLAKPVSFSHLPNIKTEVISNISKSVISAISSYSNQRMSSTTVQKESAKTDENFREKIRIENRARKKRWREENSERNKDNDLRSRVWKRAAFLFGEKDTPEKKAWADKEFGKRKEKRMARQEKQTVKNDSDDSNNQDGSDRGNLKNEDMANDPKLIKPVTDIFNILSGYTQQEDPQVALAATSAATATAAAIYASNRKLTDFEQVDSAVSLILSSIMEKINSVGQYERLSSLSKGAATRSFQYTKLGTDSIGSLSRSGSSHTGGVFDKISSAISGSSSVTLPDLKNLDIQEKRKNDDILGGELKRAKIETNTSSEYSTNQSSGPSISWGNTKLKMPHYKKPEYSSPKPFHSIEKTSIPMSSISVLSKAASPFISNKAHFGLATAKSNPSRPLSGGGLRKPGSFQLPPKHDRTINKGFGFPTA